MKKISRLTKFAAIFALCLGGSAHAATWNLSDDFSTDNNPNGEWQYGQYDLTDDSSSFSIVNDPTNNIAGISGLFGWTRGVARIAKNTNSFEVNPYAAIYRAGDVILHPTSSGVQAVVRWTAPKSSLYMIDAVFSAADFLFPEDSVSDATTTDVQVLINGSLDGSGDIDGTNSSLFEVLYNSQINLTAGSTVDFVVGYGSDNNWFGDSTRLSIDIVDVAPIPLPAAGWMLLAGVGGFTVLRKRKV